MAVPDFQSFFRPMLEALSGGASRPLAAMREHLRAAIAPQQQFVDRILGEPVAVIAIGMAARDREDLLGDQIPDAVRHAPRIARIGDGRREGRQQAQLSIGGFAQDRAAHSGHRERSFRAS